MIGAIITILLLGSACSAQSRNIDETLEDTGEILYISPYWQTCSGVGPMLCMQVKNDPAGEWQLFYDRIEGFQYVPGFTYELKVKQEKVPNPPADASSIRTILVEEISRTAVESQPEINQTDWDLITLSGKPIASDLSIRLSFTQDGSVAGNAGCNNYNAAYTLSDHILSVGPIASTKKACPEMVMQQEAQFLAALEGQHYLQVNDDQLLLVNEDLQFIQFERTTFQLDTAPATD